ncbi:MAG: lysylphosphatidylglycerol synthase domain-containing protein [Gemmatimonadetes bacterium]|nr:lysylphosphatidylglycerol synthase domain-containing protein [Gemmatimonadota bacterium]
MTEQVTRRGAGRWLAWLGGALVVAAALWTLRGQWRTAADVASTLDIAWGTVIASGAIVLAAYAVLIVTWRECVADAGAPLPLGESARIWFVSNLARYIPGALWQMGALAVLAKQQGASASAATSAALVLTVVNTLCGIAVVLTLGNSLASAPVTPWLPVLAGVAGLAALRWVAPHIVRWLAARTGRELRLPALSTRMFVAAIVGSTLSWLAYGVAFKLFVAGIMPGVELSIAAAIAIYAGSYLAGFLSLGPPAGIGVADGALVWMLSTGGIATPGEAVVISALTRLWRTALEIAPGLLYLALQRSRGSRIP